MRARAVRLLARRVHVFATALLVYGALKLAALAGLQSAAAWDAVHRWAARRLLALSRRRRGLWVKCCQYVASRGDVLPAAYVDVLGQCLDDCPADTRAVVEEIVATEVRAACGRRVEDVFVGFDGGDCLASASIAGVYRARLRKDGREVVLKVQHPEVGEWLLSDLRDLNWVLNVVGAAEPEFDLRAMLEAWLEKVPGEIDFRCEMQNVLKVRAVLAREGSGASAMTAAAAAAAAASAEKGAGKGKSNGKTQDGCFGSAPPLTCIVPKPVEELTTARMFVMEYVDGCKVTDRAALEKAGVDVERLVVDITHAFGLQLIVAGYLHGDLHSGNIMVHSLSAGGAPALIDYGVMIELDDQRRLGFARLVLAAAEGDSYGLLRAFASMGIELNRADPTASMDLINFLFRSTVPREQTIAETADFRDRMLDHQARAADGSGAAGGIVLDPGSAAESAATEAAGGAPGEEPLRRPLVDSYPGYLIFFLRTLACLRGLATGLGVQHAYLPVLAAHARRALHDACPVGRRARALVYVSQPGERAANARRAERAARAAGLQEAVSPLKARTDGWRGNKLRRRLTQALEMLAANDLMVGMQVAVYHKGELVADVAAGTMGRDNPRPVREDSLFCGFGASNVLPALLVAQAQDRHGVQYLDPLADHLPEYAAAGKASTTVGDLLAHATGLQSVPSPDMSMLRLRDDRRGIARALASASPAHAPGRPRARRFYDLNFGYLAAELVERVGGAPFPALLANLTARLGIADECFCGNMPADLLPDSPTNRIATLQNSILEDICRYSSANGFAALSAEAAEESSSTTSSVSSASSSRCDKKTALIDAGAPGNRRSKQAPLNRSPSSGSLRSVASVVSNDDVEIDGDHVAKLPPIDVADAATAAARAAASAAPAIASAPHYSGSPPNMETARAAMESIAARIAASAGGGEDGKCDDDMDDDLSSLPHYFLEPTYFNAPTLRASCVPSATGHFSARALARLYAVLANDGEVDGVRVLAKGRVAKMMSSLEHGLPAGGGGATAYGGGLRVYDVERKNGRVRARGALGAAGLGGTMGFAIPGEHRLAVAVTVNKLNVVSAASALAIAVVCRAMGAPVPAPVARLEARARASMARDRSGGLFGALKAASAADFEEALAG